MKLRKYLSFVRAGMLEILYFRLSAFIIVIGNLIYLVIVYYLWRAIYDSAETSQVNGMTFSDTLIYLVLATAMFNFLEVFLVWDMGENIRSGKIVLDLLKPMKFKSYTFWIYSGNFIMKFFMTFLPTFLIICVISNGKVHFGINMIYFVVSVIIGLLINFNLDFFVGTICLYTESIWGINIMKQVVVMLFSGVTIPLCFFPATLRKAAYMLPFQSIYDTPLTILIHHEMSVEKVFTAIGIQLVWLLTVTVINKLFWSVSVQRIAVNGG